MCSCGSVVAATSEGDFHDSWLEKRDSFYGSEKEPRPEGFTFRMLIDDCIGKLGACRGYHAGERLLGLMYDLDELTDKLVDEVYPSS